MTEPINNHAFNLSLYEEVLDLEECVKQMSYISTNTLLQLKFFDVGPRVPRGLLTGNLIDLGSYHECLGINHQTEDNIAIQGKYCLTNIHLTQSSELLEIGTKSPWPNVLLEGLLPQKIFDSKTLKDFIVFENEIKSLRYMMGFKAPHDTFASRNESENSMSQLSFHLAVCIPKVCTTKQAVDILSSNVTADLDIRESFCRLPNDKPRVAADFIAIVIFSIIGLLTIISTGYDIWHTIIQKNDPNEANKLCILFSVYSNTQRFFKFTDNSRAINCLHGIRSLTMLWVILGHSFLIEVFLIPANPSDIIEFITAFSSLWVTSATISVDTFFMLSGLLLVYTTAHKLSKRSFLKKLHFFYLNRLLRMFPVLATGILLQVSFFNRVSDGPVWNGVAQLTNDCRQYWWSTLLYVQNYVTPLNMCLPHTWYLAIDMQLYILSPLVLYWLIGNNKKMGWISLVGCLLVVLSAATAYNFAMEFPASLSSFSRLQDTEYYVQKYYVNTLTRASPFIVGMMLGYLMHFYREKTVLISKVYVILFWLLSAVASFAVIISHYFVVQIDWDNQTVDSILNSFMRPAWAASLSWLVFACKHGYGGPIEWFLSLHIFKILGRLSYAMYIMHFLLQYIVSGTVLAPVYFSVEFTMYRFLTYVCLAVIASFIVMIIIDAPCSGIIDFFLRGSKNKKRSENVEKDKGFSGIPNNTEKLPASNI